MSTTILCSVRGLLCAAQSCLVSRLQVISCCPWPHDLSSFLGRKRPLLSDKSIRNSSPPFCSSHVANRGAVPVGAVPRGLLRDELRLGAARGARTDVGGDAEPAHGPGVKTNRTGCGEGFLGWQKVWRTSQSGFLENPCLIQGFGVVLVGVVSDQSCLIKTGFFLLNLNTSEIFWIGSMDLWPLRDLPFSPSAARPRHAGEVIAAFRPGCLTVTLLQDQGVRTYEK